MNFKTLSAQPLLDHRRELEHLITQGQACKDTYADYLACQREIKRRCGEQETYAQARPAQSVRPFKARFAFFK